MPSGPLLEHEPLRRVERTRRAERIELSLTVVRLRLLALTRRPLRGRASAAGTLQVARLEASRRERMLWRVHDAARAASRDWERGDDPAEAMRELSDALARVAEHDC